MNRSHLVLVLLGFYILTAFALRSYVQYRLTGTSGFRGISGRFLSLPWLGGVLLVLALVCTIAAPFLAMRNIDRLVIDPTMVTDVLGVITFTFGTLFLLWSQGAMGASWRIGVDEKETTGLVTSGPFAWVRNPIFTGMMVSALGFVLLLPNRSALLSYVLLVVAIELQVRFVEEPYLGRTHGASYAAYSRKVGRFVPGLGLLTRSS